jgi:hypothetical protein
MKAYNPTETGDSEHVAPLMQFFELVHIGDMIQSVVQVYFDKEVVGSSSYLYPGQSLLMECAFAGTAHRSN